MNLIKSFIPGIFISIQNTIKEFMGTRIERWLKKRVPSNTEHKLSSRNIFIMPTRFGFSYLLFVVLLFLLGTNYQNNTILLLSYLLASLFITVMMHSFYNFSQLHFSSSATQYAFAKQNAYFPITIKAKKSHFDLNFYFPSQRQFNNVKSSQKELSTTVEQCEAGESQILIPYFAKQRGIVNLGRIKVFSEYSFGLFITWSMLDFAHQLVVFPQPKKLNNNHNYLSGIEDDKETKPTVYHNPTRGTDDFAELKSYIVGESQARVAWKQLARGQGKLSKHYENQQGSLRWLKLSDMPSFDIETKLSYLSFLIVEYSKTDQDFGLILDVSSTGSIINPALTNNTLKTIMPNKGFQHQQSCLIELAKFNSQEVG